MTGIIHEERIGDCRLLQGDCTEIMPAAPAPVQEGFDL